MFLVKRNTNDQYPPLLPQLGDANLIVLEKCPCISVVISPRATHWLRLITLAQ